MSSMVKQLSWPLLLLTIHNTAVLLLTRYSLVYKQEYYSIGALLFLIELTKFVTCVVWLWITANSFTNIIRSCASYASTFLLIPGALIAFIGLFQILSIKYLSAFEFALAQNARIPIMFLAALLFKNSFMPSTPSSTHAAQLAFVTPSFFSLRQTRLFLVLCFALGVVLYDPAIEVLSATVFDPAHHQHQTHVVWNEWQQLWSLRSERFGLLSLLFLAVLDGFARIYIEYKRTKLLAAATAPSPSTPAVTAGAGGDRGDMDPMNDPTSPSCSTSIFTSHSFWVRNLHLSFWGTLTAVVILAGTETHLWMNAWDTIKAVLYASEHVGALSSESTELHAVTQGGATGSSVAPAQLNMNESFDAHSWHIQYLTQGMSSLTYLLIALQSFGSILLSGLLRRMSPRGQTLSLLISILLVFIFSLMQWQLKVSYSFLVASIVLAITVYMWTESNSSPVNHRADDAEGSEPGSGSSSRVHSQPTTPATVLENFSPVSTSTFDLPSPSSSPLAGMSDGFEWKGVEADTSEMEDMENGRRGAPPVAQSTPSAPLSSKSKTSRRR